MTLTKNDRFCDLLTSFICKNEQSVAIAQRFSLKKVFIKFSSEFCEIFKNTIFEYLWWLLLNDRFIV